MRILRNAYLFVWFGKFDQELLFCIAIIVNNACGIVSKIERVLAKNVVLFFFGNFW